MWVWDGSAPVLLVAGWLAMLVLVVASIARLTRAGRRDGAEPGRAGAGAGDDPYHRHSEEGGRGD